MDLIEEPFFNFLIHFSSKCFSFLYDVVFQLNITTSGEFILERSEAVVFIDFDQSRVQRPIALTFSLVNSSTGLGNGHNPLFFIYFMFKQNCSLFLICCLK